MILEALAQRPGVVKSRNQLMDVAYQDDIYVDDRTIDSHIKRMRRKFRAVDDELQRDRDALRRRIPLCRGMTSRSSALDWSRRLIAPPPHPRGQHLRGRDPGRRIFYLDSFRSRLTQARIDQAAVRGGDDRAHAGRRRRRPARSRSWSGSARIRARGCASTARDGAQVGGQLGRRAADLHAARPGRRALVSRRRPLARQRLRRDRRRARARPLFVPPARDVLAAWPEARRRSRSGAPTTDAAPGAGRHALHLAAAMRVDGPSATCCCSPSTPATCAGWCGPSASALVLILARDLDRLGPAVALPRPDHRQAAAPARPRRAPGAARPRARGRRADPARAARRDRPARPRAARHDPEPAGSGSTPPTPSPPTSPTSSRTRSPRCARRSTRSSGSRIRRFGAQMLDVVRQDVGRLDRLVVDIAEASRLDAELSRARFEPVDLGKLIEAMLPMWEGRERRTASRSPSPGRASARRSSWATNRGSPG